MLFVGLVLLSVSVWKDSVSWASLCLGHFLLDGRFGLRFSMVFI